MSYNEELAKHINNIIERFAKKVDSLNYQNISYNQKARQQAKNEIQREANRYAQKMVVEELRALEKLPNVYHEEIDGELTHVQAIYKSALRARVTTIENEMEES